MDEFQTGKLCVQKWQQINGARRLPPPMSFSATVTGNGVRKVLGHSIAFFFRKRFMSILRRDKPVDPFLVEWTEGHGVFRFIQIRTEIITRLPRETSDHARAGSAGRSDNQRGRQRT